VILHADKADYILMRALEGLF